MSASRAVALIREPHAYDVARYTYRLLPRPIRVVLTPALYRLAQSALPWILDGCRQRFNPRPIGTAAWAAITFLARNAPRAFMFAVMSLARLTGALCAALWRVSRRSIPARYLRNYRFCRRGGLSRRYAIGFACTLLSRPVEPAR